MAAMGRGDLVVVVQRRADARRDGFLTDVEVQEAGQSCRLGELSGGLFEEANSNHAAMEIHLHVVGEVHQRLLLLVVVVAAAIGCVI
jgi:hypothetical protein